MNQGLLKGLLVAIRQTSILFYQRLLYPELRLGAKLPTAFLGSEYGGWSVYSERLNAQSIIYSFGVGEDISFDLELIHQHKCPVHAFDPTPRSIAWVKSQAFPAHFRLREYGIAAYDGTAQFFAPEDPAHVSCTMLPRPGETLSVAVKRLSTIMNELGHERIDLLKMDIEGAEYAVLKDILGQELHITQILVEFHHRWEGIGFNKTRRLIRLLKQHGYRLFAVSKRLEEFSFIKQD